MKSLLLPLIVVGGWLLMIIGLSSSIGSWDHSESLIVHMLNSFRLDQSFSPQTLNHLNFILRKCAHFSEYAILFALVYWLCRQGLHWSRAIALPLVLSGVILFAMSDEFHQSFVPGRTPSIRDVIIDSSGAAVVALVISRIDRAEETEESSRDLS